MKRLKSLWVLIGASDSIAGRIGRLALYSIFAVLAFQCVTLRFDWKQQSIVGLLTLIVGLALYTFSRAYVATLMLIVASMLTTCRYAVWRVSQVYQAVSDPSSDLHVTELFFMFLLLAAEMYAFAILLLGFIQMIYPLRRTPAPLPLDVDEWPDVDLLIPTYNEPLSVVRSTAFASINIDYPADKLHVYLLDDGRREEFREFCESIGIGYVTRNNNLHAKAGNINSAIKNMTSPLVAIFDCDHVPTRSFLQVTVGWFLKEKKLGMLQTPHHFYSPDPFERNLRSYRVVPNEGELFYGLLQDGNDLWNATFFCGSCAVLRRTALDEIGGIAVETVTEDAHTSLRMQIRGWNTAYINTPQAAGLATESLSAHVGQRIRWARGMVQILRTDNPLFVRGKLKFTQRLCYFNAMVHFLYALPRLIFLTAPLVYMLLGLRNIPGLWLTIAAYAVPHLVLSTMTNSRLQGKYRHSFWNEIYETVLAPYILGPTLLALVNPKLGKFNVTAKGGIVKDRYFDKTIARPYRFLLLLNYLGLAVAPWRYFVINADHKGAVLMNVFWILFNCVILGTANAVAVESQQRRNSVRLNRRMVLSIRSLDGATVSGTSVDLSLGGGALTLDQSATLDPGALIDIIYPGYEEIVLPAKVIRSEGTNLRFQYRHLTLEQEESLTLALYSRADSWLAEERPADRPLKSLATIIRLSLRGIGYSITSFFPNRRPKEVSRNAETAATLLLCFLALSSARLVAQSHGSGETMHAFQSVVSLPDTGLNDGMMLRGGDTSASTSIVLSAAQVAQSGALHLRYQFSPGMIPERSLLIVSFNNTTLANLVMPARAIEGNGAVLTADISVPADLITTRNTLDIRLRGHYAAKCEDPGDSRLWARIEPTSSFEVAGVLLPIANNLATLPAPFYEKEQSVSSTRIAVAFGSSPSPLLLQAAGVISSWFGVQANSHHLMFPVAIGHLPPGNAVVIARNGSPILTSLGLHSQGPHVAMVTNPSDGLSKVLAVSADDDEQVLAAARTIAMGATFTGDSAAIEPVSLPPPRRMDDAPRWVQTTRQSSLWSYTNTNELRSNGSQPIASYVRIPPDLYFGDQDSLKLRLQYTNERSSPSENAYMRVTANGAQVTYLPLTSKGGRDAVQSTDIPLPVSYIRPFANTLLFEFIFHPATQDFCHPLPPSNSTGTLLPTSNLDLHEFPHWVSLPNLELFANAGFPFTRFADLSQTVVVLPERPSERELTTMLNLLAYFGAETGYPALRVQVGDSQSFAQDRDLLVIGTGNDIPSTPALEAKLPITHDEGGLARRIDSTLSFAKALWTRVSHLNPDSFSDLQGTQEDSRLDRSLSEPFDSVIEMTESPSQRKRSIVMVMLGKNPENLFPAFLNISASRQIHGNVSIQHGSRFDSFAIDLSVYYVGEITAISRVRAWMHQEPWIGVLLPFIMGLLCAPWVHARLKDRAEERLRGDLI